MDQNLLQTAHKVLVVVVDLPWLELPITTRVKPEAVEPGQRLQLAELQLNTQVAVVVLDIRRLVFWQGRGFMAAATDLLVMA
jgi:hypothetical protein